MPELMDERTRDELAEILSHLVDPVELLLFTQKNCSSRSGAAMPCRMREGRCWIGYFA